jgi:LPXTG-motif cell wall-anchored protein
LRKLMLLTAMLAMVLVAIPVAFAQDNGAPKAVIEKGVAKADAGDAKAVAGCPAVPPDAKAGDVEAKAECKPPPPPPPPPPPKAPPPPPAKAEAPAPAKAEAPKELPKTGGSGTASLLGLGAGALLVGGGLLARRIVK